MSLLLLFTACAAGGHHSAADAGATCADEDGDGFGPGCPDGDDCRDDDPTIGTECPDCEVDPHATGCPCEEGATESCYTGPPETSAIGRCAPGTRTCTSGALGPCTGQILPTDEASFGENGADDDCDGLVDDGLCSVLEECAGLCCQDGELCYGAYCAAPGPCATDDDCDDDSGCVGGLCLPYLGRDTADVCEGNGLAEGTSLSAELQCEWRTDEDYATYSSPLVVDLDDPVDGVMEPEILFVAEGVAMDTFFSGQGRLVAIDGDDCDERWMSDGPFVASWAPPAVGDLDGDGHMEIASRSPTSDGFNSGWMVLFDDDGHLICEGADFPDKTPTPAQIANLDGVGDAEVLIGVAAFDSDCNEIWRIPNLLMPHGEAPVVADVDLDGTLEVVLGDRILDAATGVVEEDFGPDLANGWPAVADFDRTTPEPEIAVISADGARIQTIAGDVVFGPWDVFSSDLSWGGTPTAADFDGDGQVEFGVAGLDSYAVFDPDCEVGWARDGGTCDFGSDGVAWQLDLEGGGGQGSTIFDLDADGWAELLVADQCFLHVFDAATGEAVLAIPGASGATFNIPVVADTEGDGAAEIVQVGFADTWTCPADPFTGTAYDGQLPGVEVWREEKDRWADARRIWNQQPYSVTNVEEDGGIPLVPTRNWEVADRNDFRVNSGAEPGARPHRSGADLTVSGRAASPSCPDGITLQARVANRGLVEAPAGIVVRFYAENPPELGGTVVCETTTGGTLYPGDLEAVSCDWFSPPPGLVDVYVRVDPDHLVTECNDENGDALVPDVGCEGPG